MKKVTAFFLVLAVIFGLCACEIDTAKKAEWEKFIDDYNEWVDDYIELVNKYKANPTDSSITTDYLKMASEVSEWEEKAEEIKAELKDSPSDAQKFAEELLKISNKLIKAAQ